MTLQNIALILQYHNRPELYQQLIKQGPDSEESLCVIAKAPCASTPSPDGSVLLPIANNPTADDEVLGILLTKTANDNEALIEKISGKLRGTLLLSRVLEKNCSERVLRALLRNPLADDSAIALVAEKASDPMLLREVVLKASAGESTWAIAVKNQHLNVETLHTITEKSATEITLYNCAAHPLASDQVFGLLLNKVSSHAVDLLQQIASKHVPQGTGQSASF
jgi:hypothetical protein